MATEPPHEPARGAERAVCWFAIPCLVLIAVLSVTASVMDLGPEAGFLGVFLPLLGILYVIGRLNGWISRVQDTGGGSGP